MTSKNIFSDIIIVSALLLWPISSFLNGNLRDAANSFPKTIFAEDYQARQLILRNTYLYPNILTARVFQNKLNVPIHKFENNLFSLLDPNYYFFGSHPRERVGTQNSLKIPFVAIGFLLYGLFTITKLKNYRKVIGLFLILTVSISILEKIENFDLLLWPVFFLIVFHGYRRFNERRRVVSGALIALLSVVTFIEYLHLLITL